MVGGGRAQPGVKCAAACTNCANTAEFRNTAAEDQGSALTVSTQSCVTAQVANTSMWKVFDKTINTPPCQTNTQTNTQLANWPKLPDVLRPR